MWNVLAHCQGYHRCMNEYCQYSILVIYQYASETTISSKNNNYCQFNFIAWHFVDWLKIGNSHFQNYTIWFIEKYYWTCIQSIKPKWTFARSEVIRAFNQCLRSRTRSRNYQKIYLLRGKYSVGCCNSPGSKLGIILIVDGAMDTVRNKTLDKDYL